MTPTKGNNGSTYNSGGQIFLAVMLYLIILVIGFIATTKDEQWWAVSLVLVASHFSLSFSFLNERQLGASFRVGKDITDLGPGLYFAFWPFWYIRKETRNIIQLEIGLLEPEEREKAKDLQTSMSVYLLEDPLRVNWGDLKSARPEATPEEIRVFKDSPYGRDMVTDTHVTIRLRISSLKKLIKYGGSLKEGLELIRGVVVSTIISHAGKSFVGRAMNNMEETNYELRKAVEEFVIDPNSKAYTIGTPATATTPAKPARPEDSWGVDVQETQITRLGTSKRVNVAIAEKGKTIYTAQGERIKREEEGYGTANAIKSKAVADRQRLEQEGAGNAEAERLLLFAREAGTRQLAELLKTDHGLLLLQLQTLERALQSGKHIILPIELTNLLGALGGKINSPQVKP